MSILNTTFLAFAGMVITIIVAYVFYCRSRVRVEIKVFYYNTSEISKLSDRNRKIVVKYGDHIVTQVTTTKVWFWNAGARPLKRDDVPINDPLMITLEEKGSDGDAITILDYNVASISSESSNFKLRGTDDNNRLQVACDFIDCKEGAVFMIQHTGTGKCCLALGGKILGAKRAPHVFTRTSFIVDEKKRTAKNFIRKNGYQLLLPLLIFGLLYVIPKRSEIRVGENEFRQALPQLLVDVGLDSTYAQTITDNAVLALGKKDERRAMITAIVILAILMLSLMLITYFLEYRQPYPKSLKVPLLMHPK